MFKRVAAAMFMSALISTAVFGQGKGLIHVGLSGYAEAPLALSTTGTGTFRARIDDRAQEIAYELT